MCMCVCIVCVFEKYSISEVVDGFLFVLHVFVIFTFSLITRP